LNRVDKPFNAGDVFEDQIGIVQGVLRFSDQRPTTRSAQSLETN
jgi:hypothetical protein